MSRIEFYDYFTEESTRDKMENKFKSALGKELHMPVNPSDFHYFEHIDKSIYDALRTNLDGNLHQDSSQKTKFVDSEHSAVMSGFASWIKSQVRKASAEKQSVVTSSEQAPKTSGDNKESVVSSASSQEPTQNPTSGAPVRIGGELKKHTIITIPNDKLDATDKKSFAPYSDGTTITIDAKDRDIPAYVRKNAYSYLSAEDISKLTKTLENITKKQPRQTSSIGTMEDPTAKDQDITKESQEFDDFYFVELMPWTTKSNTANQEKHLKIADKYANKESAAKSIIDAEGGKVSAVRVYKLKYGGKIYLLTMVDKEGLDAFYVAANTSGLKSVEKATHRSLQSVVRDNHGSFGPEFSGGNSKPTESFSAIIPKHNTQSINTDEAIAKNLKLGINWKSYVINITDEKFGPGKQYGTKQSGYIYIFPNTSRGIVVVTDSIDKLKMVIRNADLTKFNRANGQIATERDSVKIVDPSTSADTKKTEQPQKSTETPAESPNTSAAPEPSTTPKPATEEPPTASADTQAPTMNVANDVPKEDGVPVEEIDWTKYDYLIGNSPDGNGMAVLVDTDAITTLEGARKQSATGAKFFADAVIGNKKRKDYAENTVTLGDKLFYKFEGNFDSLGTGDASDPIELLRGMGYSHEDIEYPLPSGKSARITGFYKVKKQEETFAEYRERMLNELNEKK